MKRVYRLFLSLFICLSLVMISTKVNAFEPVDKMVEATCGESYYKTDEIVEVNYLKAGVVHEKYISSSSSNLSGFNAAGSGGGGLNVPGKLYPQSVNILNIPSAGGARIVNWTKTTSYGWQRGTVKELAKDFEYQNPGWKVIAAVNGDFFDISSYKDLPETTTGSYISNGDVYKTVGSTVIGFTNSGDANTLVGDTPIQFTDYFILSLYNKDGEIIKEYNIENVNPTSEVAGLSLYYSYPTIVSGEGATAVREHSIATIPNGGFIVENPVKCIPYSGGSNGSFFGKGIQTKIDSDVTIKNTQFGVYSSDSMIAEEIQNAASIRVQRNPIGAYADCDNVSGTGNTLVRDGQPVVINDKNRHPRTMIGVKEDGTLVMVVVDGRQPDINMYGMTLDELCALMYAHGCVAAYNMDGGGSSTLLIREGNELKVMNSPSDGAERRDSNAILIVVPEIELTLSDVMDTSLVINAPQALKDVEVSNIKVTIDGKTYDLHDSIQITGLKSKETYEITYSYDRTYKGVVTHLDGDPITVTTGKKIPTIENVLYAYHNNTLKIVFDMSDPDEAITVMRLYYNGKNKTINSNEVIIENLPSLNATTLRLVAPYDIESITNSVIYITIDNTMFKEAHLFEGQEHIFENGVCYCGQEEHIHHFVDGKCECGENDPDYVEHTHEYVDGVCSCGEKDPNGSKPTSGCAMGAYASIMLTSMLGLVYLVIKRK